MRWTRPPSWSMRIGASVRPTTSRREAQRALTCSGLSTLRRNRMKPQGCASLKKAASSGVSSKPEHPAIEARVVIPAPYVPCSAGSRNLGRQAYRVSSLHLVPSLHLVLGDEALAALALHLGAEGGGLVLGQGPDADAIDGVAVHLGLADHRRHALEVRMLALQRGKDRQGC